MHLSWWIAIISLSAYHSKTCKIHSILPNQYWILVELGQYYVINAFTGNTSTEIQILNKIYFYFENVYNEIARIFAL